MGKRSQLWQRHGKGSIYFGSYAWDKQGQRYLKLVPMLDSKRRPLSESKKGKDFKAESHEAAKELGWAKV